MILQSVAVISITDLHVMVTCCISLTINIYSSNVLPNSCIGIIIKCSFGFAVAGCIQELGSDLWLPAVVLWNSAPHVSTMLRSNLDLSDSVLDILQWGPSRYYWLYWSIVQGKYPGWRGEGHQWFLHLCSLSAGGSCGLLHYSSRTRQWCSWSAHSQWFPCRRWWGWVEGDLLFSTGGERVGAVVPSWRLAWCWWSRWGPLWCAPPGI